MMPQFFRVHGSHCFLRSFKTYCSRCGEEVLYWECTHGSKVFFQYPPYGKLIKHKCNKYQNKKLKNEYSVIIKKPKGLLEIPSPSCPSCGKIFKNEDSLKNHLNQLRKIDTLHNSFIENKMVIEKDKLGNNYKKIKESEVYYRPIFGRVNIKKKA
jgi:uncharacterized C2H2 Zn-finger protein